MYKYIQDSIRNNSRSIISELTRPQEKAFNEILRGLFTAGTPVLRHLVQDTSITAKKQAEKYSYHLGNMHIKKKVDDLAFRKAKPNVGNTTIIAYDLTDIAKASAQKIEKLTRVYDGSKRKSGNGFLIHGVGINNILVKFEVHDNEVHTINQIRKTIVQEISEKLDKKGIWVFDRGNDGKQFFVDLRQNLKVQFICRLRDNRHVVIKETGELIKIKNMQPGKYRVYLMNTYNTKVDARYEYTLVISNHLEDKKPIRLLSNLDFSAYSEARMVTMYLERWGVENIFKRVKTKFELEKIRVLSYQKFVNLVSLIQLAVVVSTTTFLKIQQTNNSLITGVLLLYKKFLKVKSLTFNLDSFITFMKDSLEPLMIHKTNHYHQLSIFSRRQLVKLGSF